MNWLTSPVSLPLWAVGIFILNAVLSIFIGLFLLWLGSGATEETTKD